MKQLIIVGASGHGKVAADIAALCGYTDIAFLDDDESLKDCMGYKILGKSSTANAYASGDFFIAIGNSIVREKVQKQLTASGLHMVSLVHPDAVIAKRAFIGTGTVVMAGAVINPDSRIGNGCIINTASSVDHDNVLEDYVHISVGSHLAGTVHIGKGAWVGAGAVVSNNIHICDNCTIGAGAVVIEDIHEAGTYVGVPAKRVK